MQIKANETITWNIIDQLHDTCFLVLFANNVYKFLENGNLNININIHTRILLQHVTCNIKAKSNCVIMYLSTASVILVNHL